MKAAEVLRRYADGERNFRFANLQGQNFELEDLSEADFSSADIRGANFKNARLRAAHFIRVKAGVPRHWLAFQIITILWLSTTFCFTSVSAKQVFADYFFQSVNLGFWMVVLNGSLLFISVLIVFVVLGLGFTKKIAGSISILGALVATTLTLIQGEALLFVAAFLIMFVLAVRYGSFVPACVSVTTLALTISSAISIGFLGLFILGRLISLSAKSGSNLSPLENVGYALSLLALILTVLILYATALIGDHRKELIWVGDLIRTFSGSGGTVFSGADLTDASFQGAMLKNVNFQNSEFQETNLLRVSWIDAQGLELSQLGSSVLSKPDIRNLLVSRNGCKKMYVGADLGGVNLNGANLNEANLEGASLIGATLQFANLSHSNMAAIQALRTDFSNACFTGACLESWNVDHITNLKDVDCQYIYLLRGQQERLPNGRVFAPGEFTKLFQEVLNTVDLIFRDGVDWRAFIAAFTKVQVENQGVELAVQSIENKGDRVVIVRVNVPPDTDKEKIHVEINSNYEQALRAIAEKYQYQLRGKEEQLEIYRQKSGEMMEIIRLLANRPTTVIEGNIQGSTLNYGEIQGSVENQANPDPPA